MRKPSATGPILESATGPVLRPISDCVVNVPPRWVLGARNRRPSSGPNLSEVTPLSLRPPSRSARGPAGDPFVRWTDDGSHDAGRTQRARTWGHQSPKMAWTIGHRVWSIEHVQWWSGGKAEERRFSRPGFGVSSIGSPTGRSVARLTGRTPPACIDARCGHELGKFPEPVGSSSRRAGRSTGPQDMWHGVRRAPAVGNARGDLRRQPTRIVSESC